MLAADRVRIVLLRLGLRVRRLDLAAGGPLSTAAWLLLILVVWLGASLGTIWWLAYVRWPRE